MIIHNEKDKILNAVSDFFMEYIITHDLTQYFEMNITNNIVEDCNKYVNNYKQYEYCAGLTILPDDPKGKILILISENSCTCDTILHELTHMFDFILFSNTFCDSKLYTVMKHKYYKAFLYWSEFHAKQIDIPYMHLLLDISKKIPPEKWLLDFKQKIKTLYYPKYNEKFINKSNPNIKDIMWYLGELYVCNKYDEYNTYVIPQEIIKTFGFKINELNNLVMKCLNFEDFLTNIEDFYNILNFD